MPIDPIAIIRRIVDRQSAAWLVEQIADETGKKPWVVVSTAAGESEPRFDLEHIQQELSGVAEVAVVIDGDASWELSRLLIDYEDVYGGAARVYPAGYTRKIRSNRARSAFFREVNEARRKPSASSLTRLPSPTRPVSSTLANNSVQEQQPP